MKDYDSVAGANFLPQRLPRNFARGFMAEDARGEWNRKHLFEVRATDAQYAREAATLPQRPQERNGFEADSFTRVDRRPDGRGNRLLRLGWKLSHVISSCVR